MIGELPVSPSDQARCTTDPTRRCVTAGAPGTAADSRRIPDIFQAQRGTHVEDVIPGAAVVVTGGYDQRAIGIGDGKIDAAIVVNPNRRIAVPGNGRDAVIPNVPDMPGYSVIFRDYDRAVAAAVIVR